MRRSYRRWFYEFWSNKLASLFFPDYQPASALCARTAAGPAARRMQTRHRHAGATPPCQAGRAGAGRSTFSVKPCDWRRFRIPFEWPTISPANAWRHWPIAPRPAYRRCASSKLWSAVANGRSLALPTMAPNLSVWAWSNGPGQLRRGTTLHRQAVVGRLHLTLQWPTQGRVPRGAIRVAQPCQGRAARLAERLHHSAMTLKSAEFAMRNRCWMSVRTF